MTHIRAIALRELGGYFTSPVAYVFIVIYLLLSGFFTFFVSRLYEVGQADLRAFFHWQPWIDLFLVPAVAMRLWAEERRTGTLELLLTLPVGVAEAVAAKFLAAWAFLATALALTFPVVFSVGYLGDPDPGPIVCGYLGCFLLSGTYLCVGCLTSSLTRNQVISFILSVVVLLFFVLAGWPPVTDLLADWAPLWLVDVVAGFGIMPRMASLERGVVDLRDLVYFLSIIFFMLTANAMVLKNRRTC